MSKNIGKIIYNCETNRYVILDNDSDEWINEGLHCGDSIEIFYNGGWMKDRIEMTVDEKYYLINCKLEDTELENLKVRY